MRSRPALEALFLLVAAACSGGGSTPSDAAHALVAQVCGTDTCTPREACVTDWPLVCSVLSSPPPECRPCAPGATVYRCPQTGCSPLPVGCSECACLELPSACSCDATGNAIAVTCNAPG